MPRQRPRLPTLPARRGMILLAVLVTIVLLSLAAYQFSDLAFSEYKSADQALRQAQAVALADSGVHYAAALLSDPNAVSSTLNGNPYHNPNIFANVKVPGDNTKGYTGSFTLLGLPDLQGDGSPRYGAIDVSGKINLNAMMVLDPTGQTLFKMLQQLPNMTDEIAANIVDWLDPDDDPYNGIGAESDYYGAQNPSYRAKNGPLDSLEELLLIKDITPELLFGQYRNPYGLPMDNSGGAIDFGWSAFLTIHSREQNVDAGGNALVYLNDSNLNTLSGNLNPIAGPAMTNFILLARIYGVNSNSPSGNNSGSSGNNTNNSNGKNSNSTTNKSSTSSKSTPMSSAPASKATTGSTGGRSTSGGGRTSGSGMKGGGAGGASGGRGTSGGGASAGGAMRGGASGGVTGGSPAASKSAATPAPASNDGDTDDTPNANNNASGSSQIVQGDPASANIDLTQPAKQNINSLFDLVNAQVSVPGQNGGPTTVYQSPLNDPNTLRTTLPLLFNNTTLNPGTDTPARVNINTAPQEVLQALESVKGGWSDADVQTILSTRPALSSDQAPAEIFATPTWLITEANLDPGMLSNMDQYITTRSQVYRVHVQATVDAAGGPTARVEAIIDTNGAKPRILSWRNLTELGKGANISP
jgi:type II secretory pathway component PulK